MLSDQGGLLTILDPDTGARIERGRLDEAVDQYYASPVAGDGKVYLLSESGILTVLKSGGDLQTLHRAEFGEACYATPALEDGRIWLRTRTRLFCFGRP
jgi:outer membrane protein assembly factor BamB